MSAFGVRVQLVTATLLAVYRQGFRSPRSSAGSLGGCQPYLVALTTRIVDDRDDTSSDMEIAQHLQRSSLVLKNSKIVSSKELRMIVSSLGTRQRHHAVHDQVHCEQPCTNQPRAGVQ